MKKGIQTVALFFVFLSGGACFLEAAIMSSDARAEKLVAIRSLVSADVQVVDPDILAAAPSPFAPDLGIEKEAEIAVEQIELTDEELLAELSQYVNPTGIFMFGGEFYLIFKEKKLKVGSEIAVRFDGSDYLVEITEITGSTYRIRNGDAELQLKLK